MRVCKNRSSGKHFIYIQKTGNDEALLVTPQSEIKSLKLRLFEALEEKDEDYLFSKGIITENQLERWKQYRKDRSEDISESCEILAEELSPYQKKLLIKRLKKDLNDEKKLKEQNDPGK